MFLFVRNIFLLILLCCDFSCISLSNPCRSSNITRKSQCKFNKLINKIDPRKGTHFTMQSDYLFQLKIHQMLSPNWKRKMINDKIKNQYFVHCCISLLEYERVILTEWSSNVFVYINWYQRNNYFLKNNVLILWRHHDASFEREVYVLI